MKIKLPKSLFFILLISSFCFSQVNIQGELRQYHKTSLTFSSSSSSSEEAGTFENIRMDVTFTSPSGRNVIVPGYFEEVSCAFPSAAK